MKFEIGQQVRIRKDSIYYTYNNPYNPIDIEGKIKDISTSASLNIRVTWSNNKENSYSESDLELTQETSQMKKYKVLKDFDGRKVGEIIGFNINIDTIQWKDSNGFTVQTTLKDLISKGFIQEYKEEYKIGEWYFYNDNYSNAIFKYLGKFDACSSSTDLGILYDAYTEFKKLKVFEGTEGNNFCTTSDIKRLATQDEIKKALIEIAKYKGYKIGTKIKSPVYNYIQTINRDGFNINAKGDSICISSDKYDSDNFTGDYLYFDGKWAEIIKDPEIKIIGYTPSFNSNNTVDIGCNKNIPSEVFKGLKSIQDFCIKIGYPNDAGFKINKNKIVFFNPEEYDVTTGVHQITEKLK